MEGSQFVKIGYSGPYECECGWFHPCELLILIRQDIETIEVANDFILTKMLQEHSGVQLN